MISVSYSITILWHEDFCKWRAEIFQILIVCDSPHCATASLTTSNAKHFPRRRESNLLFRQKHYKKRPSGKMQSFNPRLYPRMREDDGPEKVSVKGQSWKGRVEGFSAATVETFRDKSQVSEPLFRFQKTISPSTLRCRDWLFWPFCLSQRMAVRCLSFTRRRRVAG